MFRQSRKNWSNFCLKIYKIGKAPLSLALGFGEVTITRYLSGQIPSKEYSDIMKMALSSPTFMKEKLQENKGKIAYFASINNAKFKNKVVPGDTLTLEVEIIKEKGPMGVGRAKATNQDGKVAVIAELTFAVGA